MLVKFGRKKGHSSPANPMRHTCMGVASAECRMCSLIRMCSTVHNTVVKYLDRS